MTSRSDTDPAARAPDAEGSDMALHRLLVTAEAGLEDAVSFWGVHDGAPTDAQVRKSCHEGLRAIRSAIRALTDRLHARPAPPAESTTQVDATQVVLGSKVQESAAAALAYYEDWHEREIAEPKVVTMRAPEGGAGGVG